MFKTIHRNQKGKIPNIYIIIHESSYSYTKEPTFQSRTLTQTLNQTVRKTKKLRL